MNIDLSPLVNAAISLGAVVIAALGSWALARLAAWLGVSRQSAAIQAFDDALTRSIQAGAAAAAGEIAAKGWNHVDVKNLIIGMGARYALDKAVPALKGIGLDPSDPNGATTAYITAELNRLFPTAIAPIAASPVTPPLPPSPPGTTADDLNRAELQSGATS